VRPARRCRDICFFLLTALFCPPPPHSWLTNANLAGTLAEEIGAWVDLTDFRVNQLAPSLLHGSVPASAANWKALKNFHVEGNQLSGAALPPLDFANMTNCFLTDHPNGGTNAFSCPWPRGAVGKCYKGATPDYIKITDADCT
jgi:hypothetical protein